MDSAEQKSTQQIEKTNSAQEFFGIDPIGKSPIQIELEWFHNHYRGDIPQLTVRAVLIGMVLGAVMSLSNLYVGLKTGWGLGVAITACILSFSIGAALTKIGVLKTNLSILENNCMQSAASSAGYSTGSTMVGAISALLRQRPAKSGLSSLFIPQLENQIYAMAGRQSRLHLLDFSH